MKKYIKLLILLLLLIPTKIYAAPLCSSNIFSNLKSKAYKTNFEYELKRDENNKAYFEITATNLAEELEISYGGYIYQKNEDDEMITLRNHFEPGKTYTFDINVKYGYTCVGETAYKKKITLPKYNIYSENKLCIEYEEFELCNKWYKGNITDMDYFLTKLDEYKESLKPKEKIVTEKSLFQKIIDFYTNNMIISIPATIIIIGGIAYIIILKIHNKKKRTKIDEDFDE